MLKNGKKEGRCGLKHALGLKETDGVGLLIYVGMKSVELEGNDYNFYVTQGDEVKLRQLLFTI